MANHIIVKEKERQILRELIKRPEGLRVETLHKLLNLPTRTIYRKLKYLKDFKLVQNTYPIWQISNGQSQFCHSLLKKDNIFELHNLSYVVKLLKIPFWWNKRKNYLIRLKEFQFKDIHFGKEGTNPYQQLTNENFVIQAYPESLIIISRKRYYSNNPYEAITEAINDVLSLLEWFSERFRFNFFADGIPSIEIRNNDFNRLNDVLSKHTRKVNGKFLVELDKRRKVWIDKSEPFGKEANYPEGQEILEKVTKDILLNKPYLPSELTAFMQQSALQIQQVTDNQIRFDQNFKSHLEVISKLGKAVDELRNTINRLGKDKWGKT